MATLAWGDLLIMVGGAFVALVVIALIALIEDACRERPSRRAVICADCKQVHRTPYPAASRVEPDRE